MIPNLNKKICIHITTYKRDTKRNYNEMDEKANKKGCKLNKFMCAICLNSKPEEVQKINEIIKTPNRMCPICQKSCDYCQNTNKTERFSNAQQNINRTEKKYNANEDSNVKNVQTSDTNVTQGLNLLNEVLTVFQNKKVDISKDKLKSPPCKDVGVVTEGKRKKDQSRLTVSTFQYSIDENKKCENGKFTIVSSRQPDFIKKSLHSIDLSKHKSSSIPQMKLEELKHSLKEKTRSKDAIEEVNRMFATVRRCGNSIENSNRPMVRSGPRVLPVVKNLVRQETKSVNVESNEKFSCKCCQTCMSSGDSFMKPECCHEMEAEKCDKCVYMLCCHYPNRRKFQTGMMICEHCKYHKEDHGCDHERYNNDL